MNKDRAKKLLLGHTCWDCAYSIKGSLDHKDWICRDHDDDAGSKLAPPDITCDRWLDMSASIDEVVAHYAARK